MSAVVQVDAGVRMPAVIPRLAMVLIGAAAYLLVPGVPATVVLLATVAGAIVPVFPAAWVGIAVLGLAQLGHRDLATDWRPYATLALIHLLHVVAGLAAAIDRRGTVQARAFARPLVRWAAIQAPAQLALGGLLLLPSSDRGGLAAIAPVVAAASVAVAVLLVVRLVPRR